MNSAPGKSPGRPRPACAIASSAASFGEALDRTGATRGSVSRKSTVPAMRVRRPSVGKRRMAWMPERPAVSAAQLSAWPWPREVTMPRPVTATRAAGPVRVADLGVREIGSSSRRLTLFSPPPEPGIAPGQAAVTRITPSPRRWPTTVTATSRRPSLGDQRGREGRAEGRLRLERVADEIAQSRHGRARREARQGRALLGRDPGRRRWRRRGRSSGASRPVAAQRAARLASVLPGRARRAVARHRAEAGQRPGAARGGVLGRFQHQEGGAAAEDEAGLVRRASGRRPGGSRGRAGSRPSRGSA